MNISLSVIVPVYNVEKYLHRCLESLVNQTLDSIEILVVNDGSTDNSQIIIDNFVAKYPAKIQGFVKPNGGLSDARNFGIPMAQGDYIGFIDSDDFVEPNLYKDMIDKAISTQADVVICDFFYEWEDSPKRIISKGLKHVQGLNNQKRAFLSPLFAWNKIYKRTLFESLDVKYPFGLWYEDIPVTLPIFAKASSIEYVEKTLIHYMQRTTSIMGSKNSDRFKEIFEILRRTYEYFDEHQLIESFHKELEYVFIEQLMLYGSFRFIRSTQSSVLLDMANQMIMTYFPKWKNNPYIRLLNIKYQIYLYMYGPYLIKILGPLIKRK